MLEDDFSWLLMRTGREADGLMGQALRRVFIDGEIPVEACRAIGLQVSKFMPLHTQARRIISAMTVSEADGFTPAEVAACNRALALCRRRENPFTPTVAQWSAMARLARQRALDVAMDSPLFPTLCGLIAPGYVECSDHQREGCTFTLTAAGQTALDNRFH